MVEEDSIIESQCDQTKRSIMDQIELDYQEIMDGDKKSKIENKLEKLVKDKIKEKKVVGLLEREIKKKKKI